MLFIMHFHGCISLYSEGSDVVKGEWCCDRDVGEAAVTLLNDASDLAASKQSES